ncbi:hypothetical protein Tco_1258781 [Tanacetum coccineum]
MPLLKDENGKEVDVHIYRSMIGSLMYLTSSRPNIMFAMCACARYKVNPKVSHLYAIKRIFSDYAGASLDKKFTTEGCQFLRCILISWQCKKQTVVANSTTKAKYVASSSCNGQLQALVDGKKIIITESTVRRNLQLEDAEGVDCLPNATIFEQLALMGYEQIFGNMRRVGKGFSGMVTPLFPTMVVQNQQEIGKGSAMAIDPHHTPTFIQPSPQPQKTQKPRRPKKKDTQVPQSRVPSDNVADEAVYKELDDSLVRAATTASSLEAEQENGNIIKTDPRQHLMKLVPKELLQVVVPGAKKPWGILLLKLGLRMYLNFPMIHCLQETTKTTQTNDIDSLKRRVKRLEKKKRSRTRGLKRLYKGRINAIDADEDITLVNDQDDADMFDVNTLTGDEVLAEPKVAVKDVNLTFDEVTLAQALAALKSVKPKVKANVVKELSVLVSATSTKVSAATTTTTATIPTPGKGIVITELAGFDEEERLAREKDEASVALTEEWDDIHAKVDVDYQLAQRLQAEKQEQFATEQKSHIV